MYQVKLKKRVQKSLKRLDSRFHSRIENALLALANDPYLGKPLDAQLKGYYSFRVWPYRIVYKIVGKKLVVIVVWIGHRQGAYK